MGFSFGWIGIGGCSYRGLVHCTPRVFSEPWIEFCWRLEVPLSLCFSRRLRQQCRCPKQLDSIEGSRGEQHGFGLQQERVVSSSSRLLEEAQTIRKASRGNVA